MGFFLFTYLFTYLISNIINFKKYSIKQNDDFSTFIMSLKDKLFNLIEACILS